MAELIIFCIVIGSFVIAHFVAAVIYKIKTHSKKSIFEIMDDEV